ncbi:MAG: transposase [Candidatus Methanomethylophilaceae archaeon]|nr:transposase [Candidatus Methanomethylophilaceae archaeon]
MSRYEANNIVDAKLSRPLGSKWDEKPIGNRNLPAMEVRYRAGMEVIENKKTVSQVARELGVSKGFVSKWKKKYQAYRVAKVRRRDVTMDMFKSTSSCPKHVKCKVRSSIKGKVLKLRNRFPFLGSAKIKALGGIGASCSTIDKVLREYGKMGNPRRGRGTRPTAVSNAPVPWTWCR